MTKIEISHEEYMAVKSSNNDLVEKEFVRKFMDIGDIMRGPENERVITENGKYYACWDSCNYRLD